MGSVPGFPKNEFPQYGGDYEVFHHTQFIESLIKDGKLKLSGECSPLKITYHDSCYLGRYNDILDAPRNVLKTVLGGEHSPLVELGRHGKNSFCCGAGGGRMWMEERLGTRINTNRAKEAIQTGVNAVATACPFCLTMFTDAMKDEHREDIVVKDIAEIVADSLA